MPRSGIGHERREGVRQARDPVGEGVLGGAWPKYSLGANLRKVALTQDRRLLDLVADDGHGRGQVRERERKGLAADQVVVKSGTQIPNPHAGGKLLKQSGQKPLSTSAITTVKLNGPGTPRGLQAQRARGATNRPLMPLPWPSIGRMQLSSGAKLRCSPLSTSPNSREIVLAPGASISTLTSSEIQGEGCLVGAWDPYGCRGIAPTSIASARRRPSLAQPTSRRGDRERAERERDARTGRAAALAVLCQRLRPEAASATGTACLKGMTCPLTNDPATSRDRLLEAFGDTVIIPRDPAGQVLDGPWSRRSCRRAWVHRCTATPARTRSPTSSRAASGFGAVRGARHWTRRRGPPAT